MTTTHDGVAHNVAPEDYHAWPEVSNSMLSAMARSPYHCWAEYMAPNRPERKATAAMKAGTLLHALVLEPHTVDARYIVRPDGLDLRTKEGREWARSTPAGIDIISSEQWQTALAQRDAIMAEPFLARLLSAPGQSEVSATWVDGATGLRCKMRADRVTQIDGDRFIVDMKTASDGSPHGFSRAVATYGYHRQQAHYTNGWKSAAGVPGLEFVFAVVTAEYPFVATAYVLDADSAQQGQDEVAELLAEFARCQRLDHWPAYGSGPQIISLPAWAKPQQEIEIAYA